MNNKNLNSLYGGDFNNIQNMLAEDVSDTSDYNVSLLNQLQNENVNNEKSGGFVSLANLSQLAQTASTVINKGKQFANQASKVINKVESTAAKATSFVDKIQGNSNEKKINNCITIAQSMSSDELKVVIAQLQKILAEKK